jgi:S-formylglutathione hydrolase FrmB
VALLHCDFHSDALGFSTSMTVILPQPARSQIGMKKTRAKWPYPTLYLLHGLSDDHTTWHRRTSIERYVAPLGLAVVMPAVQRSYYTDMAHGYRYWTFVVEELPRICRSFFPLSDRREENFVAGLSMGGYGAFKIALRCPDRYAAAASLSGVLDVASNIERTATGPNPTEKDPAARLREWENTFGEPGGVGGSENDLFHLAEALAASKGPKPALFQCCGTEDFLYAFNVRFRDHARALGLDLTYEEGPGGHEWGYWDAMIQRVLAWLPLETRL